MLRKKNHDDHNRKTTDEDQKCEDETLNDVFTSSVFGEERKFVRSTRKPNVYVAKSTFKYSKWSVFDHKKSIYDPVSSSDDDGEEVDKVNYIEEERKQNLPKGRGYVVQKFEKLRKVGDDADEITNDIRKIYPVGHSDNIIIAKLKNSSPDNHVPKKKDNNHRFTLQVLSNQKQLSPLEEDNSASTSSSYGPYVPTYEQKPNLIDGNEFPSLSPGKKQKQHARKGNATSSGTSYNRKFRPAKKLNLKDVTEFPSL